MFAVYRELEGTAYLAIHAIRRLGMLRVPPVMEEFLRQVYFTGASATGGIVLRGAFIGTLIIAYVIEVLNADAGLAVKMLLWVVLREVGPLIAAVLVIQRSGTAVATELARSPAKSRACGACASTPTITWWYRACLAWRYPTPRSPSTCR
jgi:ABC-type transporter Mla maintaining outer membrane lipid asymmetry permease subunit MlaE